MARSPELTGALLLLTALLFFRFAGQDVLTTFGLEAKGWWGNLAQGELNADRVTAGGGALLLRMLTVLLPLLVLVVLVAIGSNISQFGVLFTAETLALKPENLNPAQGFQRIFSQRTFVELLKGLLKVGLVSWVVYSTIKASFPQIMLESVQPFGAAFHVAADLSFKVGIRVVLVLMAIAILDFFYQRYAFERSIRMSRQEIKDEYRQTEGDPLVKARVRQLQREASRRRMILEIPQADVVITNPVHLAVALRYDPGSNRAPSLVAKGARLMAERIKEVARRNQVPVYEDPPLAQALFPLRVGAELPPALYHTVAQILAFVYQASRREKDRQVLADVMDRKTGSAASPVGTGVTG